jgi:hypothetical protein
MDRAKLSEADVFERDTSLALHADDAILAAVRVGSTATHVRYALILWRIYWKQAVILPRM